MSGLSVWWQDFRRRRAEAATQRAAAKHAVALAKDAFAAAYPERHHLRGGRPVAIEDGLVVELLYGQTRPPGRNWWFVDPAGSVRELPYEEAVKLINIPTWR